MSMHVNAELKIVGIYVQISILVIHIVMIYQFIARFLHFSYHIFDELVNQPAIQSES
jgi:hypothetical protein